MLGRTYLKSEAAIMRLRRYRGFLYMEYSAQLLPTIHSSTQAAKGAVGNLNAISCLRVNDCNYFLPSWPWSAIL